jgi:hypothetical protein
MTDNVNHPGHYGGEDNPYETIKVIESMGLGYAFCVGNALKYLMRAGKKGDAAEDLQKASWYAARAASNVETEEILADPGAMAAIAEVLGVRAPGLFSVTMPIYLGSTREAFVTVDITDPDITVQDVIDRARNLAFGKGYRFHCGELGDALWAEYDGDWQELNPEAKLTQTRAMGYFTHLRTVPNRDPLNFNPSPEEVELLREVTSQMGGGKYTITVRYLRTSPQDPNESKSCDVAVTGEETCGEIAEHAAVTIGHGEFGKYALKVPGAEFPVHPTTDLKYFAKPGDVFFLVEG